MPNAAALSANALKQQELKHNRHLTNFNTEGWTWRDGWTNEFAKIYLYAIKTNLEHQNSSVLWLLILLLLFKQY